MLLRTHLALGLFAVLFILDNVTHAFVFVIVTLFASVLPDADSAFSLIGRSRVLRPLQALTRHRGILHSFTFCVLISIILAFYIPIFALPFFLGYGLHLLADSFTIEGIQPFWPFSFSSRGVVRVGSPVETTIFIVLCFIDVVLLVGHVFTI